MTSSLPTSTQASSALALGQRRGTTLQRAAWHRASKVTPLGVMSNYRYWGEENTMVLERGKGSHLWDVDGNEYIDYRCGFGAIILGHGYDPVCDAIDHAIRNGSVFTMSTPWEARVAERMVRMCPCVEKVRFCSSGTEATMHALRLARAYTGREKVIKFEGNFHGVHDYLLFSTAGGVPEKMGDKAAPTPQQMSLGIPHALRDLVITLPINDEEALERALRAHGHEVAAIIAEPVLGNAASLVPHAGWFDLIRRQADAHGIVFILDEVKTGFRIAPGGAQERYGIRPHLATYAKAMGNGVPIGAFGGQREIMDLIGPGGMTHGGTFNGNVVAMVAADKVLELLEDGTILTQIGKQGEALQAGVSALLTRFDIPHMLSGPPQMWGMVFTDQPVHDFRDVLKTDRKTYEHLMMALIANGVLPEPDVREPWFLNMAHSTQDVAWTLEILESTLRTYRG